MTRRELIIDLLNGDMDDEVDIWSSDGYHFGTIKEVNEVENRVELWTTEDVEEEDERECGEEVSVEDLDRLLDSDEENDNVPL
jgi:hypothetical protein